MTRQERLRFCKQCLNRQLDPTQGLVCGLTGQPATFENECPDFQKDASVTEIPAYHDGSISGQEAAQQLSPQLLEKLRLEQNLPMGVIAGLVVGLIGAVLWGVITVATGYQIGYMAVAIGLGVGYSIRTFGKGIDTVFGIVGAALALLSCLLGNFLSIIGFIANAEGLGYVETLLMLDYSFVPELMAETFSIMDLFFYGIALYEGYKFSFRVIDENDITRLS